MQVGRGLEATDTMLSSTPGVGPVWEGTREMTGRGLEVSLEAATPIWETLSSKVKQFGESILDAMGIAHADDEAEEAWALIALTVTAPAAVAAPPAALAAA